MADIAAEPANSGNLCSRSHLTRLIVVVDGQASLHFPPHFSSPTTTTTMSAFLAQTILHPKLSQTLALLATTLGREKVSLGYLRPFRAALTCRSRVCCSTSRACSPGTLLAEVTSSPPIDSLVSRKAWQRDEKVTLSHIDTEAPLISAVIRAIKPAEFLHTAVKLAARPM